MKVGLAQDPQAEGRWDAFVEAHPNGTFFHRWGWRRVMREAFDHEVVYLQAVGEDGALRGVLPLAHVRSRLFGSSLCSLPFAVYGGVLAQDDAAQQALLAEARHQARVRRVDHLELRHRQPQCPGWPLQGLYVTFRREIGATEADRFGSIPRKQRAMVRKGLKQGLVSVIDTDGSWGLGRFHELYADNQHRHGTPALPRSCFELMREVFGPAVEVLTVEDPSGQAVSSVLSFYFRDEVLPYYAGDRPVARQLAANDFKYWELMRHAAQRGVRVFDFGRSKRGTGSYDFKCHWGFEPQPLHYEFDLIQREAVPQHNPSNPRYRLLIQAWRRLPRAVVDRLGPHLVRSLG